MQMKRRTVLKGIVAGFAGLAIAPKAIEGAAPTSPPAPIPVAKKYPYVMEFGPFPSDGRHRHEIIFPFPGDRPLSIERMDVTRYADVRGYKRSIVVRSGDGDA